MLRIIADCKVNCLFVYAGAISDLIHLAQRDSTVEETLHHLHVIAHTGWSLPEEDEDWAHSHDIPILVSSHMRTVLCLINPLRASTA